MMLKLSLAGVVVVVAASILVVTTRAARLRGKMSHCRNNLRLLGQIAIANWDSLDSESVKQCQGRGFWQYIRKAQYQNPQKTGKEAWKNLPNPDPFLCPVRGTTASNPEDPDAIDYRGPKSVAYDEAQDKPVSPRDGMLIGADRVGNHSDGGYVIYRDMTILKYPNLSISPTGGGDPLWSRAASELSD